MAVPAPEITGYGWSAFTDTFFGYIAQVVA
jgi:hypothetical protein